MIRLTRRGRGLLAAVLLVVLVTAVVLLSSETRSSADASSAGITPTALPTLGALDDQAVLMGAAPDSGNAGEAWAYRLLPTDTPPLPSPDGRRDFGPPVSSSSPGSQLVFLKYTDAQGLWNVEETPVDQSGQPYRGLDPNRQSAQITPDGGGLLVGSDSARTGGPVTVLLRDSSANARFRVLPDPDATTLQSGEALATSGGTGRVAAAAFDGSGGQTEAFFGALGPNAESAVLLWNGTTWSRESVQVPTDSNSAFQILAIGATSESNAWMLAKTDQARGDGVVVFHRVVVSGTPTWQLVNLGSTPFATASNIADGISGVSVLTGKAQPLTVTADGAWIDGSLTASDGETHDFSLYLDTASAAITGSWCDAQTTGGTALCDHPLGFSFSGQAGYRSIAWDGDGFGTRIVTNPNDPGGDDDSNLGTYARFDGTQVSRLPGGGGSGRPSAAFTTPLTGWLEGPVRISAATAPSNLATWPVAARAPFTGIAPAPGTTPGDPAAAAVAVGADGVVARYVPGTGWTREFLLTSTGAVTSPTLRAVAWPEAGRAYAVGDTGAMWLWRSETGLWEKDQAAPLGFDGNLLGVAFDPNDSSRGYAVGRQGVLLKYDKTWTQEPLPDGFSTVDFTSIAFAGSQALVAAGSDLLENSGGGWSVDPQVHALLASVASQAPAILTVAALPDGGAIAAGRDFVLERDSATAAWRMASDPLPGSTVIAASAIRDGASVRAVVSVVPDITYPPLLTLPATDPNVPPPVIPPTPLPGDGYILRETANGWLDEQNTNFAGATSDRPAKSDPVLAFDLSPSGTGWAVGGWSGQADAAGRGTSVAGGSGTAVRRNVETASIQRFDPGGAPAAAPGTSVSAVPQTPGVTTFAVGGHAQCESACALLGNEGLGPDRNLAAALGQVAQMAQQPNGPQALLYTGGRTNPTGDPQSSLEAQRYAQLLSASGGVPVFPAMSAGDDPAQFEGAFAAFSSPFGTSPPPSSVSISQIPASTGPLTSGEARTHYAFDTLGANPVRVIVIDNAAGSLADADPHQNPAEPQAPWLAAVLADAKARGIPAIVMGSRDLNSRFTPAINVATDADQEAQILRDGGASAYLFERPEENRTSSIPAGDPNGIPEFGTGTLGYRSPLTNTSQPGQPDALFGDTGFLLLSVNGAARDPATNRAPVTARLIPLIQSLSMNAVDGTLLRRSRPALFQGLGRRPVAGDRWGPASADGSPNPPGSDPYIQFPPDQCTQANCSSRILPEYTFTSADPDLANFVEQDPNSTNLHKVLQDPTTAKPVLSNSSGLLCPFNAGTTTITVTAGGFSFSQSITVQGGAVLQPCGTTPLLGKNIIKPPASAPTPAPAPAPAGAAPNGALPPPPPPPVIAAIVPLLKATPKKVVKNKPLPPLVQPPPVIPEVAVPVVGKFSKPGFSGSPPPPANPAISRPTPPGGATVRVFEQKREESPAPEQSSAYATYHPDEHSGFPSSFLYGLVLIAALAGASIRIGSRRREVRQEAAISAARLDVSPRTRPQTWRRRP